MSLHWWTRQYPSGGPWRAHALALQQQGGVDKIFQLGGAGNGTRSANVYSYSLPYSASWTAETALPAVREGAAAVGFTTGGGARKVIVTGGRDDSTLAFATAWIWDTSVAMAWSNAPSMTYARLHHAMAVANGRVYVMGGRDNSADQLSQDQVESWDAAAAGWRIDADLPIPLHYHAAASDGTYIYVCGGRSKTAPGVEDPAVDALYRYDPVANSWVTLASMPDGGRYAHSVTYIDGKLVVAGGFMEATIATTSLVYDIASDSWSTETKVPNDRYLHAAVEYDGRIWLVGGQPYSGGAAESNTQLGTFANAENLSVDVSGWTSANLNDAPGSPLRYPAGASLRWGGKDYVYSVGGSDYLNPGRENWVHEYDVAANTWTRRADLPIGSVYGKAVGHGSYIYTTGGQESAASTAAVRDQFSRFDPSANTWTSLTALTNARSKHGMVVVDDKIYVVGGQTASGAAGMTSVEMYDLNAPGNGWVARQAMPAPIGKAAVVAQGGYIYVLGGTSHDGTTETSLDTVYRYDPGADSWTLVDTQLPFGVQFDTHAVVVGEYIVMVAGNPRTAASTSYGNELVMAYHPPTNSWSVETFLPSAHVGHTLAFIAGSIWMWGYVQTMSPLWRAAASAPTVVSSAAETAVARATRGIVGQEAYPTVTVDAVGWEVVGAPTAHEALDDGFADDGDYVRWAF